MLDQNTNILSERKTPSLFGNTLQTAIEREEPWLQSQDLPSFLPFYVDKGQLKAIRNNSSELIIGRRGTGKTHLLGAFKELISTSNTEICVFISILECSQTPWVVGEESTEFASKRIAREMFMSFLREYLYQFSDVADRFLERKTLGYPKKKAKLLDRKINDLFGRLFEAIEIGKKITLHRTSREIIKELKNHCGNSNSGAKLELGKEGISGGLGIDIGGGIKREYDANEETEVRSVFHIELKDVRNLTEEILKTLGVDRFYILIDEWMELEKVTPSKVQPIFAQMLKVTLFNSKHIAVKIASIWSQTSLYDRKDMSKSQGIQLGQDIIRGPDLDIDFIRNEEEIHNFCKELLFRRLKYSCTELEALQDREGKIAELFITEIFDNERNFNAFIAATHGIPRQLMHLFMKCSAKIQGNFSKYAIDYKLVSRIAMNLYREQKRKTIDPTSCAQRLIDEINKYMESNDRRTFLIKNEDVSRSKVLRKLVDEEHIHQIPSASTPRLLRNRFKAFHIDFGNYADWIESKNGDLTALLSISVLPVFGEEVNRNVEEYCLAIEKFEEELITCEHCDSTFRKMNPIFKKFNCCPRCAEEINLDL